MGLACLLADSLELRVQELHQQVAQLQVEVQALRESVWELRKAKAHLVLVRELE
jgi:prefoldin subunit 5